ncbi:MAG: amidoligase [Balneolaceae bacterium]|nr:amidoligase [Balneolaceae bacterium]
MTEEKNSTNIRLREAYSRPPVLKNKEGEERKTGFEFEFTGLELNETARLLQSLYRGTIVELSTYKVQVKDTELGNFSIELDARLFQDKKYEEFLDKIGVDVGKLKNKNKFEERLRTMASSVVPYEIITAPIPFSLFDKLDELIFKMRQQKAKGTGSSFLHAFGLHLNPGIPDDSPETILNFLKAYVLLDPWIRKDAEIDLSRRLSPFINEFQKDYVKRILDPNYNPDQEQLIRDYINYGNTRNRPLDMLPLFMHLDKELVQSLTNDKRISARPAFHYRLPDFSIEDLSWTIAGEWNRWVLVEELASDTKGLRQYAREYLKMKEEMLFGSESKWTKLMQRWVSSLE